LGTVPKKTVKKAGKPKPRRSSEGILTMELLEGELGHKKKGPVAAVTTIAAVAGSSTEPMDTSSKENPEHVLISDESGFSPNPTFIIRSEETELDHLHTYSEDLFSTVQTAHFQHLLGNDAEKTYSNRTNENCIYWTPNMRCPMEDVKIPELPETYTGKLVPGQVLGCICPMKVFPSKELYIAHFHLYHIKTKVSRGYCIHPEMRSGKVVSKRCKFNSCKNVDLMRHYHSVHVTSEAEKVGRGYLKQYTYINQPSLPYGCIVPPEIPILRGVRGNLLKSLPLFWTNMFPEVLDPRGQFHQNYIPPQDSREYMLMKEQGCHTYPEYCRMVSIPPPSAAAKKKSLYGKTKAAIGKFKKKLSQKQGSYNVGAGGSTPTKRKRETESDNPGPGVPKKAQYNPERDLTSDLNMLQAYHSNPRPFNVTMDAWEAYINKHSILSRSKLTVDEIAKQEIFYMENCINENNYKLNSRQFDHEEVFRLVSYNLELHSDKKKLKLCYQLWGFDIVPLEQANPKTKVDHGWSKTEYEEVVLNRTNIFEMECKLVNRRVSLLDGIEASTKRFEDIIRYIVKNQVFLKEYPKDQKKIRKMVQTTIDSLENNRKEPARGRPNIPWPLTHVRKTGQFPPVLPQGYHPEKRWTSSGEFSSENIPRHLIKYMRDVHQPISLEPVEGETLAETMRRKGRKQDYAKAQALRHKRAQSAEVPRTQTIEPTAGTSYSTPTPRGRGKGRGRGRGRGASSRSVPQKQRPRTRSQDASSSGMVHDVRGLPAAHYSGNTLVWDESKQGPRPTSSIETESTPTTAQPIAGVELATLSIAAGGQPSSTATSSSTYADETMEVQASGGQPTTTQSKEKIPKRKVDSYAAATVSTTGGEVKLPTFDARVVSRPMLNHYLSQVRNPTNVSEDTCTKIMDGSRAEIQAIQQDYLKTVTTSTNLATALFMRIIRDEDIIYNLKIENQAAENELHAQNRALNAKICQQELLMKKMNDDHANVLAEITAFETTHQRKDDMAEANENLKDINKSQVQRIRELTEKLERKTELVKQLRSSDPPTPALLMPSPSLHGLQTPPPGFLMPTPPLSLIPDLSVSARMWPQEVKDKFLDDLQAVQITDPKLPRSVVQRRMKYSGEYPTCLLLYTPTGVTIEQIDRDKEENDDLVATINRVATKWTVESISAAQQKHDVPE
jgi:hypothetical protein